MNGYKMMADSYKILEKQGKIDKESAEKEIRIFEFLSTCDEDDICRLVQSAAFNDIIKGYCKKAMESAEVDEKTQKAVMGELKWMFDTAIVKDVKSCGGMQ